MEQTVQWSLIVASVLLQVLVLQSLVKGRWKQYPFAFAYCLVLFLTTIVDVSAYSDLGRVSTGLYRKSEAVRQVVLFATVLSFIDRAMAGHVARRRFRIYLAVTAALLAVISANVHGHLPERLRFTKIGRDFGLGSVVLNLLLWSILISKSNRNHQLLLLTGGLGLQFTGEAIGQSLRQMAVPDKIVWMKVAGNLAMVLTHLMRLYVWWEAFRQPTPEEAVPPESKVRERRVIQQEQPAAPSRLAAI